MKHCLNLIILLFIAIISKAQIATPALVGYWHNWNDVSAPYVQLDAIDNRYNVIEVSFAVPTSPANMTMLFTPDVIPQNVFISKIQTLQSQGKKVLLSIGGATASIDLTTVANKNAFVNSLTALLNTYGFDGIDIDIEHGSSIQISGGTIAAPGNIAQINLIDAIKQIMANFQNTNSKKLLLTMAPETAYVQGGQSGFGGIWGGYLPIIHALRDSIDVLQVQLYNSGSMYGIDANIYTQGNADFVIAMTEAVIQGFNTAGGLFVGLPASKVAIGLPACASAAGGGFTDSASVNAAIKYLKGVGPKPGSYTLLNINGYPSLRGMMTWSVNWDATNTCGNVYQYANNYENLFGGGFPLSYAAANLKATNAVLKSNSICEVYWNMEGDALQREFFIERSIDGKHFSTVGQVSEGNYTNGKTYYRFDDHIEGVKAGGQLYYRIKFEDMDKGISLSNIIMVKLGEIESAWMQVNPNPFVSSLNINVATRVASGIKLELIDIFGRILIEKNHQLGAVNATLIIDGLDALASGHYYIRCRNIKSGEVSIQKILK